MKRATLRWVCLLAAGMIAGPIVGAVASSIRAVDGGDAATVLVSDSPVWGVIASILCVAIAGAAGIMAAGLVGARDGLFCTGIALAWGAWHTGRLTDVARGVDLANPLGRLAVEGLIVGLLAMAAGVVVIWMAGGDEHDGAERPFAKQSLIGLAVMVVVGGLVAWGVARSEMIGQTFAAAAAAGVFGAMAARLFAHGCSVRTLLAAVPILAFAAPLIAWGMLRVSFGEAVYTDSMGDGGLMGLGWIMPLDWASGLLVGVPLGTSWAASMVEQHHGAGASPHAA